MRTVMETIKGWSRTDMLLHGDDEADPALCGRIDGIVARLLKHEPVQYILGETYWHGLTLKVSPAVLIPREETSELVDIIEKAHGRESDLKVLDLCTGSGCIAIALAKGLRYADVTGVDISAEALAIARENAGLCRTHVRLCRADVLQKLDMPANEYDIIVSNPPYITRSEMAGMEPNVLDYEPHSSLFVPDDDPLRFYRAISRHSLSLAKPGGSMYLEINPLFAGRLCGMLAHDRWLDATVIRDIHGKERFISTRRPS